jgi:hypothetical protein
VRLDHIAAGVLYLLWQRRRNNDGSLVPAKVLHKELLKGFGKAEFRDDLKVPAVKKTLRQLKASGMIEYGESKKSEPIPGPAPNGYRLSADAPIITWRATAAIVMLLHNHQESRLRRETLVDGAFKLGVTHHNLEDRLTKEGISDLVDWCIRHEYIRQVQVTIDETSTPTVEERLATTSKVDDHELFLQMIADEVNVEWHLSCPLLPPAGTNSQRAVDTLPQLTAMYGELAAYLSNTQYLCRSEYPRVATNARLPSDHRVARDHGGIRDRSFVDYAGEVEHASIPAHDSIGTDIRRLRDESRLLNPTASVWVLCPMLRQ